MKFMLLSLDGAVIVFCLFCCAIINAETTSGPTFLSSNDTVGLSCNNQEDEIKEECRNITGTAANRNANSSESLYNNLTATSDDQSNLSVAVTSDSTTVLLPMTSTCPPNGCKTETNPSTLSSANDSLITDHNLNEEVNENDTVITAESISNESKNTGLNTTFPSTPVDDSKDFDATNDTVILNDLSTDNSISNSSLTGNNSVTDDSLNVSDSGDDSIENSTLITLPADDELIVNSSLSGDPFLSSNSTPSFSESDNASYTESPVVNISITVPDDSDSFNSTITPDIFYTNSSSNSSTETTEDLISVASSPGNITSETVVTESENATTKFTDAEFENVTAESTDVESLTESENTTSEVTGVKPSVESENATSGSTTESENTTSPSRGGIESSTESENITEAASPTSITEISTYANSSLESTTEDTKNISDSSISIDYDDNVTAITTNISIDVTTSFTVTSSVPNISEIEDTTPTTIDTLPTVIPHKNYMTIEVKMNCSGNKLERDISLALASFLNTSLKNTDITDCITLRNVTLLAPGMQLDITEISKFLETEFGNLEAVRLWYDDNDINTTKRPLPAEDKGITKRELILYISLGVCLGIVFLIAMLILCFKCFRRKPSKALDLDVPHLNLRLEDYTLTRIPRPNTVYLDYFRGPIINDRYSSAPLSNSQNGTNSDRGMVQAFDTSVVPLEDAKKLDELHTVTMQNASTCPPTPLRTFGRKDWKNGDGLIYENVMSSSTEKLHPDFIRNRGLENPTFSA